MWKNECFIKNSSTQILQLKGRQCPVILKLKGEITCVNCLEILPCVESMNLLNSTWEQKASQ